MRKKHIAAVFVVSVLLVALSAGVAWAQISCVPGAVCDGTPGPDEILGTEEDDVILAFGGADTVDALPGDDSIFGGNGNDTVLANDGEEDEIRCGLGFDTVSYDQDLDTTSNCEVLNPF